MSLDNFTRIVFIDSAWLKLGETSSWKLGITNFDGRDTP